MTTGMVRWMLLAFPMMPLMAWLAQASYHLDGCGKKRVMYNESWGMVTDGDKDYPQNSHCEWLIAASKPGQFINLKFHEMLTECSYDYLFVYDGDSYNSAILGSFSGETLPSSIYARSGKMLILLFSDTNYVQKGFLAEYSATDCPLNCSYHGRCDQHVCICDNMWAGENCSIHLCPENCWQTEGQGVCERIPEPPRCVCKPGFSGQACSLGVNDTIGNRWHTLATAGTGFVARTGHAGVYLPLFDSLYIFGGFTLNDVLGDLVVYSFTFSQWKTLLPNGSVPSSRYGHAMAAYGESIALYGGRLANGSFCKDLWLYDVANNTWSLQKVGGSVYPPGLARHSLTLVDEYYLYLFGGNHEDGLFSSDMYRINLKEYPRPRWERIFTEGGKEMERRSVGHNAVFHSGSRSLIVYGGIAVDVAKFSKLSEKIHIFNVDTKYWSFVNYSKRDSDRHVPMERAFHSANIIGNYLVVYGGYTHQHSNEEICYDQKMYFYHLGCHMWVNTRAFGDDFPGNKNPSSQGSFSHVSAVRNGNTLLLAGGYSGAVRGDLLAYTVPASIATQTSLEVNMSAICKRHRTRESCKANPECGWCPGPLGTANDTCMDRLQTALCKLKLDTSSCLGICPLLPDCQACLAIGGQSHALVKPGDYPRLWKPCIWCVQKAECYAQGHPVGICAAGLNPSIDVVGWWGFNATNIVSLDECRYKDFRPGLTLLKYRHPPNWRQPDEVSVINSTTENFSFMPEFPGHREQEARGEYIARFRGFIHPLGTKPKAEQHLRLFIGTSLVKAVLRMSLNESEQFLEVVANHTSGGNLQRTEAHRPGDKSLFPDPSRGHKYLIDFDVRLTIHSDTSYGEQATIQLVWNGFPNFRKEFTFEFLEPYNGGVCISYNNCLACIADAACGWCPVLSQCMDRIPDGVGSGACANREQTQHLVTQPRDCVTCSDYIYCENCTEQSHCEWLIEDSHCVRRGRFEDAIRTVESCPVPCHQRTSCSSCLGDPGRCAWCEHVQQCFLFSTYTSSYLYGMCREWVDEDHMMASGQGLAPGAQCRNCSQHKTCKECLMDLRCGWCGSKGNPIIGLCVDGDFQGPSSGSCSHVTGQQSKKEDYMWSYGICPDVEECLLDLHDCHPNATCTNTFDSYTCTCNRGFRGDGHESCIKTCMEKCVHGVCSESPLYHCNCKLGWTGSDCSINCGCHNHSRCLHAIGQCDECQDWTEGAFCDRCKPGSFGNATTEAGCQKCNCNEHGNMSEGYCDMVTGICFCQDHTEGDRCDQCLNGYYGNPRNGGHCYLQCGSRQLLTSVEKGGLGSHPSGASGESCLWILTVHPELRQESLFLRESSTPSIQLTMHAGMNVACSENYVYVYDGLPNFVSHDVHWDWQNKVLSAFCGSNLNQSAVVEAKSGFLTVFYQRGDPRQGFNSTFIVHTCSGKCPTNRTCSQGWCQCQKGFAGPNCSLRVCPEDCSEAQKKGTCIEEYGVCSCNQSFGGSDCSQKLSPAQPALTTLFDPALLAPSAEHLANALPRMGHILVADHRGNLWMFGGYSLSRGPLNDVFEFNTHLHKWQQVHPQSADGIPPKGRYFHAAALVKRRHEIYVYGGLSRNEVLKDFWKFDIRARLWTPLNISSELTPLAGHTLTACGDDKIILIGGFDTHHGFLDKSFEYNLFSGLWSALNVTGGVPSGLYGHTTVYHPQTFSFYVFGGIVYKVDKTVISNDLYAFHYPTRRWTVVPAEKGPFSLSGHRFRYMHSAVTLEDYMVVVGGRSISGELARSVLVYSYACNMWVDLTTQGRRIFGGNPEPTIGLAITHIGQSIYLFGGVTGKLVGTLTRLDVPSDLCSLFTAQQNCWQALGCLYCSVHHNNRTNQSFCYSTKLSIPPSCSNPDGTVELSTTTRQCNKELVENRDCSYSASCSECLAVWPSYPNAKNACQWCTTCLGSRCIPSNRSCEEEINCNFLKQVIRDPHNCPERVCAASDCEKCREIKQCIWTRNILRTSDKGRTVSSVNHKPIYDWSCSHRKFQMASNVEVVSMPPLACPPRCVQHKDCRSCLESAGAEGGWHECHWSEALKECISPSYQPLRCAGGICGLVLRGSSERCARKCFEFTQCSQCLAQPHCGWCAFTGNSMDGRGICMEGGLDGPTGGVCNANNVSVVKEPLPVNVTDWLALAVSPPLWAYMKCPPENECLNHHHTCDKKSEECIDMAEGFRCQCRKGYISEGKICKPVCRQGCVYGTCVAPDVCDCHFGYVGNNCSTQCQCNGHSDCAGLDQLDICIKCHNDTQGKQCDKCQKFFVGNPTNNGKCVSCHIYCNGHTPVCVGAEYFNVTLQMISNDLDFTNQLSEKLDVPEEGATSEAACILCQNNTHGERCELCHPGYFRTTDNAQEPCRPCECHGHGNSCDAHTGEKCNCQNNTETDQQCSQKGKNSTPCWMAQCSKCKESFLGNPVNGQQCYRQMFVDRDYCFDPITQDSCLTPNPLLWGRTVYFVVHPKYLNVDIRVVLDVAQGGVDLYFSPKDDTFVVNLNPHSGVHVVSVNNQYGIDFQSNALDNLHDGTTSPNDLIRMRRGTQNFRHNREDDLINLDVKRPQFRVIEKSANGLSTFVTITNKFDILVVRNIQNRLVITLPQQVHDLRGTRFFMVLHGVDSSHSNVTYGSLFFRQDQPRIDLFVFFSVFFSCFFLFLAVCVVIWKVKQAVDIQRARQRQAVEMEHMASRPFARVTVIIDENLAEFDFLPYSPALYSKKSKGGKHSHGRDSPKIQNDDKYLVRPVALEPTDDGVAAVGTVMMQLPGSICAPVKLTLGSALVTTRLYPNTYSSIKACMRRRTSYHST